MLVKFPPKSFNKNIEDRQFLEELDKRLHYVVKSIATTNMSRTQHEISYDQYHNTKLEPSEIEKILSLVNSETEICMTPVNTNMGFSIGFQLVYTFDRKTLLCFKEDQLPEGYDFKKLKETFNHPENIRMLENIGMEKPKERGYYDY